MATPPRPEPPRWEQVPCGTCSAPVIWAISEKGSRTPINPEPLPTGGNIRLRDTGGPTPLAVVLNTRQQFGLHWLYTTHFVTCPQAAQHRRGRSRS